MGQSLNVFEYDYVKFDDMPDIIAESLQKPAFADGLERFLAKQKLQDAIKLERNGIRATNFVGVLKYKNIQIEILPKLLAKDTSNREQILKNLIFMLGWTRQLNVNSMDSALMGQMQADFIETLMLFYAQSLFNSLKYSVPKNYVRQAENIACVRGKLNLTEHIKQNCANQAKFYCNFDEFSEDNLLNQTFLFVSRCLGSITKNPKTKKILGFIVNNYADISFKHLKYSDVEKIQLNRSQKCFEVPLMLAKMFIGQMSVDMSKNNIQNIALLWDMNILFEEFVFEFIKRNKNKIGIDSIEYQRGRRLLRCIENDRKYGNTYVDMFVKTKEIPSGIVLDTKYKTKSRFDTDDVFQVVTYCKIHQSENAILLYPRADEENTIANKYYLNMDNDAESPLIRTATFDLNKDLTKQENQNNIISDLRELFFFQSSNI